MKTEETDYPTAVIKIELVVMSKNVATEVIVK